MANNVQRQITLDGQRNIVVKWAGILDTADFSLTPALALSDCNYNDPLNKLSGFRLDMIEWSMSANLELQIAWNATVPQLITPISGRGRINMWNYGGFTPNQSAAGFDGSINLYSNDYASGASPQNFTVTLELIKLYKPR